MYRKNDFSHTRKANTKECLKNRKWQLPPDDDWLQGIAADT